MKYFNIIPIKTFRSTEFKYINRAQFGKCEKLLEFLQKNLNNDFHSKYKYKYEIVGDEETKFLMIGGDPAELDSKLNNLIRQPRKFVCLNDNIDYTLESEALELKRILKKFYTALFPLKSSFELVEKSQIEFSSASHFKTNKNLLEGNTSNRELNIQRDHGQSGHMLKFSIREINDNFFFYLVLFFIVIFVLLYAFKKFFIFLFEFLKVFFNRKSDHSNSNLKRVVKTKKREHKISNSLLQQMNNENTEESDEPVSESDISNIRDPASSTGITMRTNSNAMRSKKIAVYKKFGKKSNISHI